MMTFVMTGCYQPITQPGMNKCTGEHLPAHMIGDSHDRHDSQNRSKRRNMDWNDEYQQRNHNGSGYGFDRMKAHRGPGGWRSAGMMNRMGNPEP